MNAQSLWQHAPVATLLLASFVGLFTWQVLTGMSITEPTTQDLVAWGANALPLTMINEPWRLVSSAFLHVGLMHLLFNGFAVVIFGRVAEPILGSLAFLCLFVLSAIGGNLLNSYITWHQVINEGQRVGVAAGASGGIMGIGAALLVLAAFKVRMNGVQLNLQSLGWIMAINLAYGFVVPGIDNAGHIGGAVTGMVLALLVGLTWRTSLGVQRLVYAVGVLALSAGFAWGWWALHQEMLGFFVASTGI